MDENPILATGATFGEIADVAEDTEAQATPDTQQTDSEAATDGGTTSEAPPEIPGILKDDETTEDTEDKPDLTIDADVQKFMDNHPVIKNAVEAFMARKDKGIQSYIEKSNTTLAKVPELEKFQEDWQPLVTFYQEFENPATVDAAFDKLCLNLEKTYNRPFGKTQEATVTEDGEPKSKFGLEFPSDDKVVEAATNVIVPQIKALLDERLGPVSEDYKARTAERELTTKVTQALPLLKSKFEIAADPWVTPEKVTEAMTTFPGLDAKSAFSAHFVEEIARYTVKHSGQAQTVRQLPKNDTGGKTRADLKVGASFADIVASEATL